MNTSELSATARALVAKGRGILAADESTSTIKKRFDSIKLESTEENRRAYREMLFTTPGAQEYTSGVIMYDETLRQKTKEGVPFPTYLAQHGMVISSRGSHGGYRLARTPEQITAAQILDVFEGPIAITECSGASSQCGIERQCRVGGAWQRVNAAIRRALEEVTLRQLAGLDATSLRVADLASEIRVDAWVNTGKATPLSND